jgi:PKD repeat protein
MKDIFKKLKTKYTVAIVVLICCVGFLFVATIIQNKTRLQHFLTAQIIGTPPTITDVIASNVGQTNATIYWTTDQPSDSTVILGTTVAGVTPGPTTNTPVTTNGTTVHRVELSSLLPCTRYYFRVSSQNAQGNITKTGTAGFDTHGCGSATSGDVISPTAPTNLVVTNVTQTGFTLTWSPSVDDRGAVPRYVVFGYDNGRNSGRLALLNTAQTSYAVTGLTPGTTYSGEYGARAGFVVQGIDASDNYSLPSTRISVTTLPTTSTVQPAPVTVVSFPTNWSSTSFTATLLCTAGAGLSCTQTKYLFVPASTSCPVDTSAYSIGTTPTKATEGTYRLCYYSIDSRGTAEGMHFIDPVGVDLTKPRVQILTPIQNATISGTSVTLTPTVSDALSGVSRVEYIANSRPIATSVTFPFSVVWDTTQKADGAYTVIATAYDTAGNKQSSSSLRVTIANDCQTLATDSGNFSSALNPTGNPIGGGHCYSNIVSRATAQYVVSTKSGLKNALLQATNGQIIYVDDIASIDLTGEHNLTIPGGVTLASGRGKDGSLGALLYSNSYYTTDTPLFKTGGTNVRITGLRLRGPNPEFVDHDYPSRGGFANGIKSNYTNLRIDNNELYAWDKWAVWLYIQNGARIDHNYFHDTKANGYGYHIWTGGAGSETNGLTTIEANLFGPSREVLDSNSQNSYIFQYNAVIGGHFNTNVLRHGGSECPQLRGPAGNITDIKNNIFFTLGLNAFSQGQPRLPTGRLAIMNNYFQGSYTGDATRIQGLLGFCDTATGISSEKTQAEASSFDPRFIISNNFLNGSGRQLPVAVITASTTQITAGESVTFDASHSTDPNAIKVNRFMWQFGDGEGGFSLGTSNGYQQNVSWQKNVSYTFTKPGMYKVGLTVFNAYGIPSETAYQSIVVRPVEGTNAHILSAWVKDSYILPTVTGRYEKQLVVMNTDYSNPVVVWRDDVAGDEGWQHVVVNLDTFGISTTTGTQKRIGYRLISISGPRAPSADIYELWTWVDDIYLFGAHVGIQDPSFDIVTGSSSPWKFVVDAGVSSMFTYEDSRSGKTSFRLRFGDNQTPLGRQATATQVITF